MKRVWVLLSVTIALAVGLIACSTDPVIVEKEVIREVPVEKVVIQEVVKEVQVPGETVVVEKEVVKTVEVEKPVEVIKEVVKTVTIEKPVQVIVEKEVVRFVEVEKPTGITFSEAPTLLSRVQSGALPPVEERLPIATDVMFVPTEEIGRYGGTWRRAFNGVNDHWAYGRPSYSGMVRWNLDLTGQIPYIAKSWEISDGGKLYTFKLRRGMKWSDGSPHTAEDWVYQHNDVMGNSELTPNAPFCQSSPEGGLAEINKIDDYTFTLRFAQPNYTFVGSMCYINVRGGSGSPVSNAAYMKRFHKDYADPAALAKLIADGGYDDWTQLYREEDDYMLHPDRPTLRPWALSTPITSQRVIADRNPFYFGVDRAGNQLPYMDRMVLDLIPDANIINVKAVQGDLDFQSRHIKFSNYATLKENEAGGGFRVVNINSSGSVPAGLYVNLAWEGPEAEYLTNLDFRKALSHAIDRQEIIDILFFGLGDPRNAMPPRSSPFWPGEEYAYKNATFDTALADQLLDSVGLDKRDSDGFRMMGNGKTLNLIVTTYEDVQIDAMELVKGYWEDVGLKLTMDVTTRGLAEQKGDANQAMFCGAGSNVGHPFAAPRFIAPVTLYGCQNSGAPYATWWVSGGTEGSEPPPKLLELMRLTTGGRTKTQEERNVIGQDVFRLYAENQWYIGFAADIPIPHVVNADMGNVSEAMVYSDPMATPTNGFPEAFFFRK